MEQIVGSLIQLGVGGVMAGAVVWFLWHLVSKTFPDLTKMFQDELNLERADCERRHVELKGSMDKLFGELRSHHEIAVNELRKHHGEALQEFRGLRHSIGEMKAIPRLVELLQEEMQQHQTDRNQQRKP